MPDTAATAAGCGPSSLRKARGRRCRVGVSVDVDQGEVLVVVKRSAGVDCQTRFVQQVGVEHFQRDRLVRNARGRAAAVVVPARWDYQVGTGPGDGVVAATTIRSFFFGSTPFQDGMVLS